VRWREPFVGVESAVFVSRAFVTLFGCEQRVYSLALKEE